LITLVLLVYCGCIGLVLTAAVRALVSLAVPLVLLVILILLIVGAMSNDPQ